MYLAVRASILRWLVRRGYLLLLGILSCTLTLLFVACSAPSPNTSSLLPTEFRIGYQVVPNAELLAKTLGLVEEKFPDTDIKWVPYSSGYGVNVAMIEGDIDVGLVGSVPAATGIVRGLPYQVYFIHNVIGENEALAVTQSSGIKSVADLVGKKIGTPFGSTSHFSLLSALEQADVDQTTVTILDMQPAEMLVAWQRGTIDGGFVWQPTLGSMVSAEGNILITAKSLAEEDIVTADIGVVHKDFSASYSEFLTGYSEVLDDAVHFYREQPEKAAEAIATELKISPEASLAVMNELVWLDAKQQSSRRYLGTPDEPGDFANVLKLSAEFMVDQKAIPAAAALETFQQALLNEPVAEAASAETAIE